MTNQTKIDTTVFYTIDKQGNPAKSVIPRKIDYDVELQDTRGADEQHLDPQDHMTEVAVNVEVTWLAKLPEVQATSGEFFQAQHELNQKRKSLRQKIYG